MVCQREGHFYPPELPPTSYGLICPKASQAAERGVGGRVRSHGDRGRSLRSGRAAGCSSEPPAGGRPDADHPLRAGVAVVQIQQVGLRVQAVLPWSRERGDRSAPQTNPERLTHTASWSAIGGLHSHAAALTSCFSHSRECRGNSILSNENTLTVNHVHFPTPLIKLQLN